MLVMDSKPSVPAFMVMAAYPPRKAKDDPKNAGTFPLVTRWNKSVPKPANNRVADFRQFEKVRQKAFFLPKRHKTSCACKAVPAETAHGHFAALSHKKTASC